MIDGLNLLNKLCKVEEASEILQTFKDCNHLDLFFKGERNHFEFGKLSLCGGVNNLISWKGLFKALEIEPQKLRPIFHRKSNKVPHFFPYNFSWFGLNQDTHYIREVEISEEISTYDELGYFEYSDEEAFIALSKILEKEIDVYKFMNNEYVCKFKVDLDGKFKEIINI